MARPRHILLIVADDHRHTALGCADPATRDAVRTPRLDALAARGVRLHRAYHAGSPVAAVCQPSRAMTYTGRGPFDLPADLMDDGTDTETLGPPAGSLLGQRLGDAGYRTHHVGKWHNRRGPFQRAFQTGQSVFFGGMPNDHFQTPLEAWDGRDFSPQMLSGCHGTDVFAESARLFMRRHADEQPDRPFFLSLAFTAPHDPRQTHPEYHARHPADGVALPPNFTPEPTLRPDRLPIRDSLVLPLPRDPAMVRREIAGYYAMVEHLDAAVGRVLDTLDEAGLADDTLVAYTADHGYALGEHGLLGKQNLHDASVRVPLIVAGPGVARGVTSDALAYNHDLFPTLLQHAGIGDPEPLACRGFNGVLADPGRPHRDHIGSYYADEYRMVTDGRRKLIRTRWPGRADDAVYDTDDDPWETRPAAPRPDDPLLETLQQWQTETGDPQRKTARPPAE